MVLHDGILTTGVMSQFLRHAPILAFINGCETARSDDAIPAADPSTDERSFVQMTRVFGIARPFLNKGSYVLGTRWRVSDTAASAFAEVFYKSVLGGAPIGGAITDGRKAAYAKDPSDLSWASYVFYGDPRLMIELDGPEAPLPPTDPPSVEPVTPPPIVPVAPPSRPAPRPALVTPIEHAAREYVRIRETMDAGTRRTLEMERLLDGVRAEANGIPTQQVSSALSSQSEGLRIAGVVLAAKTVDRAFFPSLLEIVRAPFSAFEEYHALIALHASVDQLNRAESVQVQLFLLERLADPEYLATDRAYAARELMGRLERRLTELDQSGR